MPETKELSAEEVAVQKLVSRLRQSGSWNEDATRIRQALRKARGQGAKEMREKCAAYAFLWAKTWRTPSDHIEAYDGTQKQTVLNR